MINKIQWFLIEQIDDWSAHFQDIFFHVFVIWPKESGGVAIGRLTNHNLLVYKVEVKNYVKKLWTKINCSSLCVKSVISVVESKLAQTHWESEMKNCLVGYL